MPLEPDLLFAALAEARSEASAIKAMRKLEDDLTPLQLYDRLDDFDRLKGHAGRALMQSDVLVEIVRRPPQPYERQWLHDDVALNLGPGTPETKTLVIGLCGRSHRLMLSWSHFLQAMPADRFDVAIVADRSNTHFFDGVAGYADGLLGLARRLRNDLAVGRYRRVICYGTSTGGLPALRIATLINAERGISVGGMPLWAINRLRKQPFDAFDPLCDCMLGRTQVSLFYVYGGRSPPDATVAAWIGRMQGIRLAPIAPSSAHNVVHDLYKRGQLPGLFKTMFG